MMYLFMTYCMLFFTKVNQESSKPRLMPLNEGGVSELLNKVSPAPTECLPRPHSPGH